MPNGSSRYARYGLIALFGLVILYFISTSSLPTYYPSASSGDESSTKHSFVPSFDFDYGSSKHESHDEASSDSDSGSSTSSSPPAAKQTLASDFAPPTHEQQSWLPPELLSPSAPGERVNATLVTLARNSDVWEIARSIRQVEDRFNRNYNYPWVFLNDQPFEETFINVTSALVSGPVYYGEIPKEQWSFPSWIDQKKAEEVREDFRRRKIIYGDSVSYRHMCRFESGFFFRHPLMNQFEYYWRVEPSVEMFCDIHYDPFQFMKDNKKKYSFVLSLYEYVETIPTLWESTKKFMKNYPEYISDDNSMAFLSDDGGETYNNCHFWSNFEIGNLDWLRSKPYLDFFESLDHDGGFFYERWGDAPVHSIAAALMLPKEDIHFFNDIAYYHVPFIHCPTDPERHTALRCHCNPNDNFDWHSSSCTSRFYDVNDMPKPDKYVNRN